MTFEKWAIALIHPTSTMCVPLSNLNMSDVVNSHDTKVR